MSKLFWAMLSFITRLPVPRRWSQGLDFEHYSRGIITFPLIGLLLGAISGLVFMVLQAWCGCYGGNDGGDFHPRSASQTYAGRANRRYAGSCYRAW